MTLNVAQQVWRPRHQRSMAVAPVALKLGDTHTQVAFDQKHTFDTREVFSHCRTSDDNVFASNQTGQAWHIDKVRLILKCTFEILRAIAHTRGCLRIVEPHLSHTFIGRSGKSWDRLGQTMALHIASQAGDTQGQLCMHATPVTMELLVADARLLGQQGKGFDHNSPPILSAPYPSQLRPGKLRPSGCIANPGNEGGDPPTCVWGSGGVPPSRRPQTAGGTPAPQTSCV